MLIVRGWVLIRYNEVFVVFEVAIIVFFSDESVLLPPSMTI